MRSGRSSHTDTRERRGEERRGEERRGEEIAGVNGERKKGGSKTKSEKGEEDERTVNERTGEENLGYTHLGCIDCGAKTKLQTCCMRFFPLMSFLKYHKSDVDNYSTRDCEMYCLSKTRHNPLGIHKKSQSCQLTDTAREISNGEEDKEEEEIARKVQSESKVSRWSR